VGEGGAVREEKETRKRERERERENKNARRAAAEHVEKRRFARAGWPHHRGEHAALELAADAAEHTLPTREDEAEIFEFDSNLPVNWAPLQAFELVSHDLNRLATAPDLAVDLLNDRLAEALQKLVFE
tara:strand:+ start:4465 stop:4848 length:384 start_codon:yes stop_codon:yes gene_type:complete